MRKCFLLSIACLLQTFVFAAAEAKPKNKSDFSVKTEAEWKTEYTDESVKIESSLLVFEDNNSGIRHERVIFRYTNLSPASIVLSFERTLYYDGVCYGCDKQEKRFEIMLASTETKQFSSENKDKAYYIFSKDLKNSITKKLDNYHIVKIEKQIQ